MPQTVLMTVLALGLALAVVALIMFWRRSRAVQEQAEHLNASLTSIRSSAEAETARLTETVQAHQAALARLAKWQVVGDAEAKAAELLREAQAAATVLRGEAERLQAETRLEAEQLVGRANEEARALVSQAEAKAAEALRAAEASVASVTSDAFRRRDEAQRLAQDLTERAEEEARSIRAGAAERAKNAVAQADATLAEARTRVDTIVADAMVKAEAVAGDAFRALQQATELERTIEAMRNTIEGYGDRYLVPSHSLIDGLAEDVAHTEAGQKIKLIRDQIRQAVRTGRAASCDYVEANRRETAISFITDAFNGKADSILARVKHDNAGTLQQELRDDFALVNHNGQAFRNARITDEYLTLRVDELHWAAVANELKLQEREEQRRIKEQIREEEKARKEYERAMRETAKEEEMLRRAMEKATQQLAKATDEQKARYEQQLQELSLKLTEAEQRNQRALSMAQQTRRGHVYIISNIGSFGEHIYKIGLTRRLEPLDRIRELGDSSVPFEFDVHALMFAEDAPALEHQLHRHFVMSQVNKVNYRKEFFRVDIAQIRAEIEKLGLTAKWTMAAEAQEYRESLAIERLIKDDPAAREAWLRRQLTYEAVLDRGDDEDDAPTAGTTAGARVSLGGLLPGVVAVPAPVIVEPSDVA
jgi:hypothetical protein